MCTFFWVCVFRVGLDSATSYHLINVLNKLSTQGVCTIIATIHQPSQKTFELFHNLIVMKLGKIVYQGNRNDVVKYFDRIGFPIPPFTSAADHILDVVVTETMKDKSEREKRGGNYNIDDRAMIGGFEFRYSTSPSSSHSNNSNSNSSSNYNSLSNCNSNTHSNYKVIIDNSKERNANNEDKITWISQFRILLSRCLKEHYRKKEIFLVSLAVTIIVAFFSGSSVWRGIGRNKLSASKRMNGE